ncbi:MAG: hypothetical protein H2069_06030 [Legionella sp.]|nr:hypothetical protein [Legionella sp.]
MSKKQSPQPHAVERIEKQGTDPFSSSKKNQHPPATLAEKESQECNNKGLPKSPQERAHCERKNKK